MKEEKRAERRETRPEKKRCGANRRWGSRRMRWRWVRRRRGMRKEER